MCNHYENDIHKLGLDLEIYGFHPFSELPREIYPDRLAPVLRLVADGRMEATPMRWGFPPSRPGSSLGTNFRNLDSTWWAPWLKPQYRCLVPFTAFAEPWPGATVGRKEAWFATTTNRPAMFAGIWRPWTGTRGLKSAPVVGEHLVFSFMTCDPNGVVGPIHQKAMPSILTTEEEQQAWLTAPQSDVPSFQRPLPDELLRHVNAAA